jgi:hypothetical protein
MKTTREILVTRHRAAQPKLDEIRRKVVADACRPRRSRFNIVGWCEELFRLPRPALAVLGGVWIAILVLNLSSSETPRAEVLMAKSPANPSPETLRALREQKQLFAEMVGSGAITDADVRRFVPRPRSERFTTFSMA